MRHTITSLEPQQKKPSRLNVYLDGQFAFGLSYELVVEERLKVGTQLDSQRIHVLIHKDIQQRLFQRACHFLSFRPRSVKEVQNYLVQKSRSFSPKLGNLLGGDLEVNWQDLIQSILGKLNHLKLLNDQEFARWWVESRQKSSKPKGLFVIRRELFTKGVPSEIIDRVLDSSDQSEYDMALQAARKVLYRYQKLPARDFNRKLSAYLVRRGFGWEVVKRVFDKLLSTR